MSFTTRARGLLIALGKRVGITAKAKEAKIQMASENHTPPPPARRSRGHYQARTWPRLHWQQKRAKRKWLQRQETNRRRIERSRR